MDEKTKHRFCCKYCDTGFASRFSCNRHIKAIHKKDIEPVIYNKDVWSFKCLETNCNQSFQHCLTLINHLENTHNLEFKSETVAFRNMDEFSIWKQSVEEESCSYYVSGSSKSKSTTYFYCNRSRTSKDKKRNPNMVYKRKPKRQGYYHIDSSCTSQMKLLYGTDGKVTVYFHRTHYGHEPERSKIRLPKREKGEKAQKANCCLDICTECVHYLINDTQKEKIEEESLIPNSDIDLNLFCSAIDKTKKRKDDERIREDINGLFWKLQNFDYTLLESSTLEKIRYHFNIVLKLTELPHDQNTVQRDENNKRYIEPQLRFHSTKKKKTSTVKLSDIQRTEIKKSLLNNSGLVISNNAYTDHVYGERDNLEPKPYNVDINSAATLIEENKCGNSKEKVKIKEEVVENDGLVQVKFEEVELRCAATLFEGNNYGNSKEKLKIEEEVIENYGLVPVKFEEVELKCEEVNIKHGEYLI